MTDNQSDFRFSGEKRRILLVEDDIINQEMIRESVSGTYDLTVAETGEEALTIISERYETLSIVLLDLNLRGVFNKHIEILLTKRKSNAILSVTICQKNIGKCERRMTMFVCEVYYG